MAQTTRLRLGRSWAQVAPLAEAHNLWHGLAALHASPLLQTRVSVHASLAKLHPVLAAGSVDVEAPGAAAIDCAVQIDDEATKQAISQHRDIPEALSVLMRRIDDVVLAHRASRLPAVPSPQRHLSRATRVAINPSLFVVPGAHYLVLRADAGAAPSTGKLGADHDDGADADADTDADADADADEDSIDGDSADTSVARWHAMAVGTGSAGCRDGHRRAAAFAFPGDACVTSDTDAVIVADTGNHLVRRVSSQSGQVSTPGVPDWREFVAPAVPADASRLQAWLHQHWKQSMEERVLAGYQRKYDAHQAQQQALSRHFHAPWPCRVLPYATDSVLVWANGYRDVCLISLRDGTRQEHPDTSCDTRMLNAYKDYVHARYGPYVDAAVLHGAARYVAHASEQSDDGANGVADPFSPRSQRLAWRPSELTWAVAGPGPPLPPWPSLLPTIHPHHPVSQTLCVQAAAPLAAGHDGFVVVRVPGAHHATWRCDTHGSVAAVTADAAGRREAQLAAHAAADTSGQWDAQFAADEEEAPAADAEAVDMTLGRELAQQRADQVAQLRQAVWCRVDASPGTAHVDFDVIAAGADVAATDAVRRVRIRVAADVVAADVVAGCSEDARAHVSEVGVDVFAQGSSSSSDDDDDDDDDGKQ